MAEQLEGASDSTRDEYRDDRDESTDSRGRRGEPASRRSTLVSAPKETAVQRVGDSYGFKGAPGTLAGFEAEVGGTAGAVSSAPAGIHYSRTRQVELCDKALMENKVIAGCKNDPRVEAYRQLRSQVLGAMRRNGWRTLAVTSARERAGKTLTCVNLAICMSQEMNQTVLLVDLDLRKPDVARTLGLQVDKGIIDHLLHAEPIEKIMINPGHSRLVIIPGTRQDHFVSEVLTSPEMKVFLADITARYEDRIIIFDLPPLLRNDDAMVFVPKADACLFVVEDGVSRPDDMEYCFQLLRHSNVIGTVLNKSRE
ncbi:CpsD/CapB family tyrosine-protein kinase [Parahaliea mediterranea]|uniref:non-specific protein-tyrosine kinase n=1 Tax=Parahaliea mediterranea TaxID=651086 RepID=A0A939DBM0_9GAMM|nr:CpsD/CapB family tyrosine-protein kinase [Parahaliea mediterranea]MBN7795263.1 CpsD/CapB family tyrosine-protein kinase [Parahaliea mediterranea]